MRMCTVSCNMSSQVFVRREQSNEFRVVGGWGGGGMGRVTPQIRHEVLHSPVPTQCMGLPQ